MNARIGNIIRETKTIRKKPMEILNLKNTVSDWIFLMDWFNKNMELKKERNTGFGIACHVM